MDRRLVFANGDDEVPAGLSVLEREDGTRVEIDDDPRSVADGDPRNVTSRGVGSLGQCIL